MRPACSLWNRSSWRSMRSTKRPRTFLGGLGGTSLVAGVRWAARGKDAGSVRIEIKYGRNRGRRLAAIQRGPAAQPMFRQALLLGDEAEAKSGGHGLRAGPSAQSCRGLAHVSP